MQQYLKNLFLKAYLVCHALRFFQLITISILLSGNTFLYVMPALSQKAFPVIAFSMDYQGCLGNENYQQQSIEYMRLMSDASKHKEGEKIGAWQSAFLVYNNLKLTNFILQKVYKKHYLQPQKAPIIFLNGSNRQFQIKSPYSRGSIEYFKDAPLPLALNISESFLAYMKSLLSNIASSCEIDTFLLGDVYAQKRVGYTWENAKKMNHSSPEATKSIQKKQMDRDKLDIVYGQIHRLSDKYCKSRTIFKKQSLDFYFLDDNLDILNNLNQFLSQHPDLLPKNADLYLIHYTGETLIQVAKIKGKGMIDKNYLQSIYYTYEQFKEEIKDGRLHKIQLLSDKKNLDTFKRYRSSAQSILPSYVFA